MSIKLALLKSGEEVIANIRELIDTDEKVVSFMFTKPYVVKLLTPQVLIEEKEKTPEREYSVSFYPWMPLSLDTDIPVSTDWVVSIVEPVEMVKKSYEEKMNGRGNVIPDGPTSGGTGGDGRDIGTNSSSYNLNEQISFSK